MDVKEPEPSVDVKEPEPGAEPGVDVKEPEPSETPATTGDAAILPSETDRLRSENRKLDDRVSLLLSELAEHRRDRARTYVADTPQVHLIADEWKHFRDQDFRGVARSVLKLLPPPENPADKRRQRARIHSLLARELLMRPCEDQLADRRRDGLRRFLATLEEYPLSPAQRLAIVAVVETELTPGPHTPSDRGPGLWSLLGLDVATEKQEEHEDLQRRLKALAERATRLVAKILSTEPPARLELDAAGMTFDEELHDAMPGGAEHGTVLWSTFPRYCVGERVIVKASVFAMDD
jgi:hypothetical protein